MKTFDSWVKDFINFNMTGIWHSDKMQISLPIIMPFVLNYEFASCFPMHFPMQFCQQYSEMGFITPILKM